MLDKHKQFIFNKHTTNFVKGVAISFMIIHHFFGYRTWLVNSNGFIGTFFLNISIEAKLAEFGRICIVLFAFLTGFGLFYSYQKGHIWKTSIKKIGVVYLNYWLILFLLFVPLNLLCGSLNLNPQRWIYSIFALNSNTNTLIPFAWYIHFYVLAMITLPFLNKFIKGNIFKSIMISILPFYLLRILIHVLFASFRNTLLINIFDEYLFYMPCIMVGYCFSKYNIFEKMNGFFIRSGLNTIYIYIVLLLGIFILRKFFAVIMGLNMDLFYVPLFIFVLIKTLSIINSSIINNILTFLGKHSMNLWFLHAMFFFGTNKLQWIAYFPKISVFVFVWTVVLLIPISMFFSYLLNTLLKLGRISSSKSSSRYL